MRYLLSAGAVALCGGACGSEGVGGDNHGVAGHDGGSNTGGASGGASGAGGAKAGTGGGGTSGVNAGTSGGTSGARGASVAPSDCAPRPLSAGPVVQVTPADAGSLHSIVLGAAAGTTFVRLVNQICG